MDQIQVFKEDKMVTFIIYSFHVIPRILIRKTGFNIIMEQSNYGL